jgi:hypothetical protein
VRAGRARARASEGPELLKKASWAWPPRRRGPRPRSAPGSGRGPPRRSRSAGRPRRPRCRARASGARSPALGQRRAGSGSTRRRPGSRAPRRRPRGGRRNGSIARGSGGPAGARRTGARQASEACGYLTPS